MTPDHLAPFILISSGIFLSDEAVVDIHVIWLFLKHLDHLPYSLGGPLAEQESGPVLHQLGLSEEAEDDGAPVVGVQAPRP